MERNRGNVILTSMGIVYLALSIIAIFNAFYYHRPHQVFWFCYTGMFLIGIGFLGHERTLIQTQLYLLLIPDAVWTVDFLSYLIQGESALGIVDYFFAPAPWSAKIVTLQHLTTIPLGIYFFYHRGIVRKPLWIIVWFQLVLLYGLTRFATEVEENVNCIYAPCGTLVLPGPYTVWWFALSFLMVYATHRLVQQLPNVQQAKLHR